MYVCVKYHYNAKLSLPPVGEEEVMSRHRLLILFFPYFKQLINKM